MVDYLSDVRRRSLLGVFGEQLAAEALEKNGFRNVQNLNDERSNYPYADLIAEREGARFFIGVKARNERRADGRLSRRRQDQGGQRKNTSRLNPLDGTNCG